MLLQSQKNDCGKTVVREMLYLFYKDKNCYRETLAYNCTDFYEIKEELSARGLFFKAYSIGDIDEVKKANFPLVAQVKQADKLHFVIVLKISKKRVLILDPEFGKLSLSLFEFLNVFTSFALLYQGKEKKKRKRIPSLIPINFTLLYTFLYCIQALSLILFSVYSSVENAFFYQVGFLISFLLSIALQFTVNFIFAKTLDKRHLKYLLKSKNRADFKNLSLLSQDLVKLCSECVTYASLITAISVLLLQSSKIYSILLLIPFCFLLFKPPLKAYENKVNRKCTLDEHLFLLNLEKGKSTTELIANSEKSAAVYLLLTCLNFLFEASVVTLAVLLINIKTPFESVWHLISTIASVLTFSYALNKACALKDLNDKIATDFNRISPQFSQFLKQEDIH